MIPLTNQLHKIYYLHDDPAPTPARGGVMKLDDDDAVGRDYWCEPCQVKIAPWMMQKHLHSNIHRQHLRMPLKFGFEDGSGI